MLLGRDACFNLQFPARTWNETTSETGNYYMEQMQDDGIHAAVLIVVWD